MKQYMKYVKPYALYFLLAPILMLVEVVGEVFMPKFLANIINIGIPEKNTGYIVAMGFAMAGMAIVMMLGGIGGGYFSADASTRFSFSEKVRSGHTKVTAVNPNTSSRNRTITDLEYFLFSI